MLRSIVMWSVLLGGCVCAPRSLQAASLEWRVGYQQAQWEARAMLVLASPGQPWLGDLLTAQPSAGRVIVATDPFQLETRTMMDAQVPVLALPESGTLILLGIGLAGLASLMRRKKPSS